MDDEQGVSNERDVKIPWSQHVQRLVEGLQTCWTIIAKERENDKTKWKQPIRKPRKFKEYEVGANFIGSRFLSLFFIIEND